MKIRKIITFTSALTLGSCLAVTLSSCVGVNSDVTDNIVSRGDGSKISNNVSFRELLKNALASESGTSAFKKKLVDDLLYSWYKNNITKLENKDKWAELEKEINEAYDKKIDSYKTDHKGNWEYYFQNEVLDPVGGTEELYKKSEMASKARSAFTTNAFEFTKYLSLRKDGADKGVMSDVDTITTEKLLKKDNWNKINFYAQANGSKYSSTYTFPAQYARIQKAAFEGYAKKNNPTSVSMALWKYGDPVGGIEALYNKNTLTGVDLKSSFTFPAFSSTDPGTSGDKGTEQLFGDFITKLKTVNSFEVGDGGLLNISKSLTEDSETQILVNTKHLFDDKASGSSGLEAIFAGATGDLINTLMTGTANDNIPEYDVEKFVNGTTTLFDIFFNQGETKPEAKKSLDFDLVYPGKNIVSTKKNDLFNEKSKYSGAVAANVVTSGRTTVRLKKGTTLLNSYLTRDEFGVHFISLDGEKYLNEPTVQADKLTQSRRNDVLKAKSLLYRENSSEYSKVEIDSGTKSYFDSNTNDIILQLAIEDYENNAATKDDTFIFTDVKQILGENIADLKSYISNDQEASELKAKVQNTRNATQKLLTWGNTYSKNFMASNTSPAKLDRNQYTNGLATPIQFSLTNGARDGLIPTADRNLLTAGIDTYAAAMLQAADDNGVYQGKKITGKAISDATEAKKLAAERLVVGFTPDIVKTGTRQWSESIIGKGKSNFANAINMAIISFSKDGNNLANGEKIWALKKYIDDTKIANNFDNAIASMYNVKKVISKTDGLSKFYTGINPWISGNNIDSYLDLIKQETEVEKLTNNYSTSYSDDYVSDLIFKASIAYLATDGKKDGATENGKNLIEYLRSIITWDNPGAVVWMRKDNSTLNPSFAANADLASANIESVYGWSNNYLGTSSVYQGSQVATNNPTTGFSEFSEYWTTCEHVVKTDTKKLMGFTGLQTANSSSLPTTLNDAIFTSPMKYGRTDATAGLTKATGVLARYKSVDELCKRVEGADARSIRDLAAKVKTLCPLPEIQEWSETISHETYQSGDDEVTAGSAKVGDLVKLIDVQARFDRIKTDATLKTKMDTEQTFTKINAASVKTGIQYFEPRNPNDSSSPIISEKDKAYTGYRATYYQLNHDDLYSANDGDDWSQIKSNLVNILGGNEVYNSIIIQYAQDSSIQSKTIASVIKSAYNGDKVTVYTRAMNDQLGQSWVNDWKKKP